VIDMRITMLHTMILGFGLTLVACDGGKDAKKDADNKAPTAKATVDGPGDGGDKAGEQADAPSLDPKVERAVTLANQISAQPDAADSILAEAGMDRETFEKLLYEIARDPELSKSYAVAREA
jgi:hypothetical protein